MIEFDFMGTKYNIDSISILRHDSFHFEFSYPVFDAITNFYIQQHPSFVRDDNLMLSAPGACPSFADLTFYIEGAQDGPNIPVVITSKEYSVYDEKNDKCNVLFKASENLKGSFGLGLMQKYIVSFDHENQQVGFTQRELQHSVKNSIGRINRE